MNALNDAETIAALRAENAMLAAAVRQAEAPTSGTFKPFSWLHHGAQHLPGAETVCLVRDVALGIATTLELVTDSESDAENDAVPYLSAMHRADMTRFAMVAAHMLAGAASRECDRLNDLAGGRSPRG